MIFIEQNVSTTTFIVEQQHHGICVIFCMFVLNIIRFFLNEKKNVLKPHQTQVMNAQNQSRFPNEKSTSTLETAYATESTQ